LEELETLLNRTKLTKKETIDPWLARVLITELLWGTGTLPLSKSNEFSVVNSYREELIKELGNMDINSDQGKLVFQIIFNFCSRTCLKMPSTAEVFTTFILYSFAMFTLPFGAFFGAKHVIARYFDFSPFADTVCCSSAAVVTVNVIIAMYVVKAYRDAEFDKEEKPIDEKKGD
jgi:putative methyltransferase